MTIIGPRKQSKSVRFGIENMCNRPQLMPEMIAQAKSELASIFENNVS